MATDGLYKEMLLDHFHHPRNKGGLAGADRVCRGSNPSCGDEIEIGLFLQGDRLESVRFRGRGCSICIASSSLMTEAVTGATRSEALRLSEQMQAWFAQTDAGVAPAGPGDGLEALSAVRDYPARYRCALLAWEALHDALVP